MTETVTCIRAGAQTDTDAFGQPIYGPDVETPLDGALFAPGGTSEPVEVGRAPVVSEPTLYWRNQWPDVIDTDRFRVRGVEYEVEGMPAEWHRGERKPLGGLVVTLRRTDGN